MDKTCPTKEEYRHSTAKNNVTFFIRQSSRVVIAALVFACMLSAQSERNQDGVRPDEMANLEVVAIEPSIAFPKPNEPVDVAVQIRNASTHSEQDVSVSLFVGSQLVAKKQLDLDAAESTLVNFKWIAKTGQSILTAHVDANNRSIELKREDNVITREIVVCAQPSKQIDLAVLKLESVRMNGDSEWLRVQIRNHGNVDTRVPLIITASNQFVALRLVDISPKSMATVTIPFDSWQMTGEVTAEINPRYRLQEKKPGDNVLVKDLRPRSDLRVEGLSISTSPNRDNRTQRLSVSFRIVNMGSTPVSRMFRTSILSHSNRSDGERPLNTYNLNTDNLKVGGIVYVSQSIAVPNGKINVRVQTDADNVIAEDNEGNNISVYNPDDRNPEVGRWVSIGPTSISDSLHSIGRIHSIAVHPTITDTIYVAGPNCGIWKTNDGGSTWIPVGDSLPSLSVSALAIDPATPTVVYAVLTGTGVFRSNDGAVTWTQISQDLGTPAGAGILLIDPSTPSRLYLNSSNGVFRSNDSGVNWIQVKTGIVNDLVMDPSNPATLYAAVQGDGVYKTTMAGGNGNSSWTKLSGLPANGFVRVTLAVSAADPNIIYAGLSGSPFRIYRSTDATNFSLRYSSPMTTSNPSGSIYNPWLGVDPGNPSVVYLLSANFQRSTDGGSNFAVTSADLHECQKFAADPLTPGVIYIGRDNGIFKSRDRGVTFSQIGAGITNIEFYDGAVAASDPNLMIGGTQDNGTIRFDGDSTVWSQFSGGDGATVDIDPSNSQILYTMNQGQESMVRWVNGSASCIGCSLPPSPPTVCSNLHFQVHPKTSSTLLASCLSLWRADNPQCPQCPGNGSIGTTGVWTPILPSSPTLGNVVRSTIDGTTDLYYAGTNIGTLWAGQSGANWQKIFSATSARAVSDIEVDPDNPSTIYVSIQASTGDRIFRLRRQSTVPTAQTVVSQPISSNLPSNLSVKTLGVDRMFPFTIYAGTNLGVYRGRSTDNGNTWSWTAYNNGLPTADIRDLEVHPITGAMRASSYGRSAFEINTDFPIGSLLSAEGRVNLLRVHDEGTGYGPPTDFIDVEVVITLDSKPGKAFGFQLRNDSNRDAHGDMLELLRKAFSHGNRVRIDYLRTGLRNGRVIRVESMPN